MIIHKDDDDDDDDRGIPSALPSRDPGKMLKDVLRSLLESFAEVNVNNDKFIVDLLLHKKV